MKRSNTATGYFLMLLITFFVISTVFFFQVTVASENNSKIPQTIDELRASIDSLLKEYSVL
jgi:CHASE3 domain sensor protein